MSRCVEKTKQVSMLYIVYIFCSLPLGFLHFLMNIAYENHIRVATANYCYRSAGRGPFVHCTLPSP